MKLQANKQTDESIFIDVLDQKNNILNSVKVDNCMNFEYLFTKKWSVSRYTDEKIVDFAKDLDFKFFNPAKIIKVIEKTVKGIYFEINGNLHYYYKATNSIVLCRKIGENKYWYNYGCNLNAPQEREVINFLNS